MKSKWNWMTIRSVLFVVSAGIVGFTTGCADYPVNPPKDPPPEPRVVIRHVQTEYVAVSETKSSLITTKINILTFEITPENLTCKALEFCGRAILYGPPSLQEHVIHFRTDQTVPATGEIEVQPNVVSQIQSGSVITLFRIKHPTNEYAPFEGDQGKIQSLEILNAWRVDEHGCRTPVRFVQETG